MAGDTGPAWPNGAKVAVSLTFDVDAETGALGDGPEYARRLMTLSEGRFGVTRGMPRILALLAEHGIHGTFFVPGWTAEHHAGLVSSVVAAGHEVGHHGYIHLRTDKITVDQQRDEIERGFTALAAAGAPRPVGYRSPVGARLVDALEGAARKQRLLAAVVLGRQGARPAPAASLTAGTPQRSRTCPASTSM